jgi:uncharacterized protein (TIGR02996 family)
MTKSTGSPCGALLPRKPEFHRQNIREISMTPEELALVDAIHADPRSDSPRLAYADWLENHGAADYAEFIRLQCERPYVAICTRDQPGVSTSHKFPWADEAARDRLKRLISLWPIVIESERLAAFRQDYYDQEFVRGLALWEIDEFALFGDKAGKNRLLDDTPPLVRFRLFLRTTRDGLASWLNRPVMRRVDVLRLNVDSGREDPDPAPDLSHVDFSFFKGLEEINLGQVRGYLSGELESRARAAGVRVTDDY